MTPDELDRLGSQLSHDLKGALRILSLSIDLASQAAGKQDLQKTQESLEMAKSTSRKLWRLIEGLIGIGVGSRAQADEVVEMQSLVSSLISEYAKEIESRGTTISIGELDRAHADSYLIQEVWRQLLENALRHGKPSEILIGSTPEGNQVVYYIEDNGSGVSEDLVPNLFSSITKGIDSSGVGLGLLFCRRVISRHAGKIWHSRENNRTRFSFNLPR